MWFLNKKTGVKWEIVDKELIDRLSKDDFFEELEDVKEVIEEIVEEEVEEVVTKKATKKK